METIFRVDWDDLELDDVAAFLADAGDEGLTWEAKGTERPHPGSVRKHASGFANSIGGVLLIGVNRQDEAWVSDGVDFEGEEPAPWLGRVIRNGLRPVPQYDVKAWPTGDGRQLAVVRIDAVPDPPCMTMSGEVFERVSGETVRVIDPAVLARLTDRGKVAEAEAEARAQCCATRRSGR
jgi:predicted HTH transcriptional regulator